MQLRSPVFIVSVLLAIVFMSSCRPTRRLKADEALVVKNTIGFPKGADKVHKDKLQNIIKQTPNRKLVGLFPFYLGIHNLGNKRNQERRDKKFNEFFMNIGEPAVVLDSFLTDASSEQMALFLRKKGYFHAKVNTIIRYKKSGKKAKIEHMVEAGNPFTIKSINYDIEDTTFFDTFLKAAKGTLLSRGKIYDEDLFEAERKRMTDFFKNEGFYRFARDLIIFEIDSTIGNNQVDLRLLLRSPVQRKSTENGVALVKIPHQQYKINDVFVVTDFDKSLIGNRMDTLQNRQNNILYYKELEYKADIISKAIFIQPGTLYDARKVDYTYSRLAALRAFKFINIRFEELDSDQQEKFLNCFINLTDFERQSFGFETDATNRAGNLGINGNLVYRNRNTFRGAETFELKLKGGLEAVQLSDQVQVAQGRDASTSSTATLQEGLFNTFEYGIEGSVYIPELWIPNKLKENAQYERPKTTINLAFNNQNRPDFSRRIFNLNYQYSWKSNNYNNFSFNPLDLSLIQIDKQPFFEERLETINNPFLTASYSNHLIGAIRLGYSYSNQSTNVLKNYVFFRTNIESAGNLLRTLAPLLNLPERDDSYLIGNIKFAQYVKLDVDLRKYDNITKWSQMVYRIYAGVGVPLENLNVLPFEKSFFGGGANDMRGWVIRSLGPGSMADTVISVDQVGDISILMNLEYRFDIFGNLKGALFTDIGNIWLLREDKQRPNGHFEMNRFYKEFAVSGGFGIRYDFSFFIIRFDLGMKLRDPKHLDGERWFFSDKTNTRAMIAAFSEQTNLSALDPKPPFWRLMNVNFGIGFPF